MERSKQKGITMYNMQRIKGFLENQKKRLLTMDGGDPDNFYLNQREMSGFDQVQENEETGEKRGVREVIYDNTINWMTSRQGQASLRNDFARLSQEKAISEDTLTTAIATFTTSLLPMVRRIYSSLIAMDLVSVQPLAGPSGYIYWLDHIFTSTHSADSITAATTRLDQVSASTYADSSEQGTIREIQLRLQRLLIEVETKKLKGDWSIEAEQDLSSQWKLNLENELMPAIGDEIVREIDNKIITALLGAVASNVNWNSAGYLAGDSSTLFRKAYDATLWDAIVDANANIFGNFYLNANWLVMNGATFARIQKLDNYIADPQVSNEQATTYRRYEGVLAAQYKVYVDPWFTSNTILVGVRSTDWKRAVGYYAPYIPLFMSDKYIINDDFTQFARGAMTRYAYGFLPHTPAGSTNNGLATVTITSS
jgi:hypothetical protein